MDEYNRWNHHYNHNYVPAFGRWDYGDDHDLPYTQCFETVRQAYTHGDGEERDLYVAGDLYQNDVVTPAVIVVPRHRRKGGLRYPNVKEVKKEEQNQYWGYSYSYDIKELPCSLKSKPKPVDEDLYKIPHDFLHVKPKKQKRGLGLFSSCLLPACV